MVLILAATLAASALAASAPAFQHPAGWHRASDIARIRAKIESGAEPWKSAAELLLNDTSLLASYKPAPVSLVCRTCCKVACCAPGKKCPGEASSGSMERDCMAAYYLMMRWVATSDLQWADAAQRVIDAWSAKLTGFAGHDQMLAVGLYGGHLAQAAELLAFAKPGAAWPLKARAQKMFLEVVHPGCSQFCGRTNDGWPMPYPQTCADTKTAGSANGNWDAVCMSGVASWAVFLDNATMLATVHDYFFTGAGNGKLTNYIIDPEGECQESGRDQGHTQLGIFNLIEAAFTIWHATSSTDIFLASKRRLQAGLEYTAKYNLGYDVPFRPNCGPPGLPHPKGAGWCFKTISPRGSFAPMWEMAASIYAPADLPFVQQLLVNQTAGRSFIDTPACRKTYSKNCSVAGPYRPERGRSGPIIHGGAHVGDGPPRFGTLSFFGAEPAVPLATPVKTDDYTTSTRSQKFAYADGSELVVTLFGETGEVIHVQVTPKGASAGKTYDGWLPDTKPAVTSSFSVKNSSGAVTLSTSAGMALTVSTTQPTVELTLGGQPAFKELRPIEKKTGADCLPRDWIPLDKNQAASLSAPKGSHCVRHTRSLAAGASIFGFGQAAGAIDRVGTQMLLATSAKNDADGQSHAPAPFFIDVAESGLAHGVLFKTTRYSSYDIGNTSSSELRVHVGDGSLSYFLLAGPHPADVVRQLGALCGRPPLPPPWALQFKYHAMNSVNQSTIVGLAQSFATKGIPLSHIVIENYLDSGHKLAPASFPDVEQMTKTMDAIGCKTTLWIDPHVQHHHGTNLSNDLIAAGCVSTEWYKTGGVGCNGAMNCGYSDFLLTKCKDIWTKFIGKQFIDKGVAGFKMDQDDGGGVLFRDNTTFPSGYFGAELHNVYGFTFQKLFHEMFQSRGKRTWLQCRGNHLGGQAFGTSSYSDSYGFDNYVQGLVNAGFTGLVWAPETRYATCDADYARRVQLMLLGSQSQFNAWQHGDLPWWCNKTNGKEEYFDMFVVHHQLRMKLGPTLYTAAYVQSQASLPLLRPLLLQFPADKPARSVSDQWLLGDGLMVAPAGIGSTTGKADTMSRDVYFPGSKISWYDYWSGKLVAAGPKTVRSMPTPVSHAPVFVRGGAILPLVVDPTALKPAARSLRLLAAMTVEETGTASGTLFLDDGEALDTSGANKHLLVNFTLGDRQLSSKPVSGQLGGFAPTFPSVVSRCTILGVKVGVTSLLFNGKKLPKADCTLKGGVLQVVGLSASVGEPWTLQWTI